eukprot:GHVQ01032956.1.p1 GENE.GHVQ01032956.1~~GHVQ01032956.1.p1  ORF type:complete len:2714 (+),score=308.92 GHVQ01032956.1:176-8317(+)
MISHYCRILRPSTVMKNCIIYCVVLVLLNGSLLAKRTGVSSSNRSYSSSWSQPHSQLTYASSFHVNNNEQNRAWHSFSPVVLSLLSPLISGPFYLAHGACVVNRILSSWGSTLVVFAEADKGYHVNLPGLQYQQDCLPTPADDNGSPASLILDKLSPQHILQGGGQTLVLKESIGRVLEISLDSSNWHALDDVHAVDPQINDSGGNDPQLDQRPISVSMLDAGDVLEIVSHSEKHYMSLSVAVGFAKKGDKQSNNGCKIFKAITNQFPIRTILYASHMKWLRDKMNVKTVYIFITSSVKQSAHIAINMHATEAPTPLKCEVHSEAHYQRYLSCDQVVDNTWPGVVKEYVFNIDQYATKAPEEDVTKAVEITIKINDLFRYSNALVEAGWDCLPESHHDDVGPQPTPCSTDQKASIIRSGNTVLVSTSSAQKGVKELHLAISSTHSMTYTMDLILPKAVQIIALEESTSVFLAPQKSTFGTTNVGRYRWLQFYVPPNSKGHEWLVPPSYPRNWDQYPPEFDVATTVESGYSVSMVLTHLSSDPAPIPEKYKENSDEAWTRASSDVYYPLRVESDSQRRKRNPTGWFIVGLKSDHDSLVSVVVSIEAAQHNTRAWQHVALERIFHTQWTVPPENPKAVGINTWFHTQAEPASLTVEYANTETVDRSYGNPTELCIIYCEPYSSRLVTCWPMPFSPDVPCKENPRRTIACHSLDDPIVIPPAMLYEHANYGMRIVHNPAAKQSDKPDLLKPGFKLTEHTHDLKATNTTVEASAADGETDGGEAQELGTVLMQLIVRHTHGDDYFTQEGRIVSGVDVRGRVERDLKNRRRKSYLFYAVEEMARFRNDDNYQDSGRRYTIRVEMHKLHGMAALYFRCAYGSNNLWSSTDPNTFFDTFAYTTSQIRKQQGDCGSVSDQLKEKNYHMSTSCTPCRITVEIPDDSPVESCDYSLSVSLYPEEKTAEQLLMVGGPATHPQDSVPYVGNLVMPNLNSLLSIEADAAAGKHNLLGSGLHSQVLIFPLDSAIPLHHEQWRVQFATTSSSGVALRMCIDVMDVNQDLNSFVVPSGNFPDNPKVKGCRWPTKQTRGSGPTRQSFYPSFSNVHVYLNANSTATGGDPSDRDGVYSTSSVSRYDKHSVFVIVIEPDLYSMKNNLGLQRSEGTNLSFSFYATTNPYYDLLVADMPSTKEMREGQRATFRFGTTDREKEIVIYYDGDVAVHVGFDPRVSTTNSSLHSVFSAADLGHGAIVIHKDDQHRVEHCKSPDNLQAKVSQGSPNASAPRLECELFILVIAMRYTKVKLVVNLRSNLPIELVRQQETEGGGLLKDGDRQEFILGGIRDNEDIVAKLTCLTGDADLLVKVMPRFKAIHGLPTMTVADADWSSTLGKDDEIDIPADSVKSLVTHTCDTSMQGGTASAVNGPDMECVLLIHVTALADTKYILLAETHPPESATVFEVMDAVPMPVTIPVDLKEIQFVYTVGKITQSRLKVAGSRIVSRLQDSTCELDLTVKLPDLSSFHFSWPNSEDVPHYVTSPTEGNLIFRIRRASDNPRYRATHKEIVTSVCRFSFVAFLASPEEQDSPVVYPITTGVPRSFALRGGNMSYLSLTVNPNDRLIIQVTQIRQTVDVRFFSTLRHQEQLPVASSPLWSDPDEKRSGLHRFTTSAEDDNVYTLLVGSGWEQEKNHVAVCESYMRFSSPPVPGVDGRSGTSNVHRNETCQGVVAVMATGMLSPESEYLNNQPASMFTVVLWEEGFSSWNPLGIGKPVTIGADAWRGLSQRKMFFMMFTATPGADVHVSVNTNNQALVKQLVLSSRKDAARIALDTLASGRRPSDSPLSVDDNVSLGQWVENAEADVYTLQIDITKGSLETNQKQFYYIGVAVDSTASISKDFFTVISATQSSRYNNLLDADIPLPFHLPAKGELLFSFESRTAGGYIIFVADVSHDKSLIRNTVDSHDDKSYHGFVVNTLEKIQLIVATCASTTYPESLWADDPYDDIHGYINERDEIVVIAENRWQKPNSRCYYRIRVKSDASNPVTVKMSAYAMAHNTFSHLAVGSAAMGALSHIPNDEGTSKFQSVQFHTFHIWESGRRSTDVVLRFEACSGTVTVRWGPTKPAVWSMARTNNSTMADPMMHIDIAETPFVGVSLERLCRSPVFECAVNDAEEDRTMTGFYTVSVTHLDSTYCLMPVDSAQVTMEYITPRLSEYVFGDGKRTRSVRVSWSSLAIAPSAEVMHNTLLNSATPSYNEPPEYRNVDRCGASGEFIGSAELGHPYSLADPEDVVYELFYVSGRVKGSWDTSCGIYKEWSDRRGSTVEVPDGTHGGEVVQQHPATEKMTPVRVRAKRGMTYVDIDGLEVGTIYRFGVVAKYLPVHVAGPKTLPYAYKAARLMILGAAEHGGAPIASTAGTSLLTFIVMLLCMVLTVVSLGFMVKQFIRLYRQTDLLKEMDRMYYSIRQMEIGWYGEVSQLHSQLPSQTLAGRRELGRVEAVDAYSVCPGMEGRHISRGGGGRYKRGGYQIPEEQRTSGQPYVPPTAVYTPPVIGLQLAPLSPQDSHDGHPAACPSMGAAWRRDTYAQCGAKSLPVDGWKAGAHSGSGDRLSGRRTGGGTGEGPPPSGLRKSLSKLFGLENGEEEERSLVPAVTVGAPVEGGEKQGLTVRFDCGPNRSDSMPTGPEQRSPALVRSGTSLPRVSFARSDSDDVIEEAPSNNQQEVNEDRAVTGDLL